MSGLSALRARVPALSRDPDAPTDQNKAIDRIDPFVAVGASVSRLLASSRPRHEVEARP